MVWKDEVDSAAVQVERLPQILHRHRGALEVPSRTAASPWRIPRSAGSFVLGLHSLPEREILRVLLRVIVLGDPGAGPDLPRIEPREAPVLRKAIDREVDGTVVRAVGDPLLQQTLDERERFGDVFGRFRIDLSVLAA